jgi:hypothetical protein
MAVFKTTCPDCGAILKSSNPMPSGKKVKCPKCGKGFTVPEDEEPPAPAQPVARTTKAAKKPAPAPAAKPDDDDDEVGTYGVVRDADLDKPPDEDEDDDDDDDDDEDGARKKKKKKGADLTFALDLSVTDPRGPAAGECVRPSNLLMMTGSLSCFLCLVGICWSVFPLIFSQDWVEQADAIGWTYKQDSIPPTKPRSDLKPDELAKLEDAESEFMWSRLIAMSILIVVFLLSGLWVFGGVKMQNLESYAWAMTGSIIALVVVIGVTIGLIIVLVNVMTNEKEPDAMFTMLRIVIVLAYDLMILPPIMCLRTLSNPKVKEGFAHEVEEAKKRR